MGKMTVLIAGACVMLFGTQGCLGIEGDWRWPDVMEDYGMKYKVARTRQSRQDEWGL